LRGTGNFRDFCAEHVRMIDFGNEGGVAQMRVAPGPLVMGWTPPDGIYVPRWWC
jgi:hypothetical protein